MKARIVAYMLVLAGCPDDPSSVGGTESGSTSDDGTDSSSATPPTATASASTMGTSTAPGSSSEASSSESGTIMGCGDGVMADDEQCDDGNDIDDDECSNDCIARCGLVWESLLSAGPDIEFITLEDGDIRLGGTVMSGENVVLYNEVFDADGNSLESEEFDVGVVSLPLTQIMTAVAPQGSYLFSNHDLGNGQGARVALFDGASVVFDVELEAEVVNEPEDRGIALAPNGDVVVSGGRNMAKSDDDVWVARLNANNGNVRWSGNFSGPFSGGFSTDDGGPVAVAGDDSVYVMGLIRQELDMVDINVIKFDDGGGAPAWVNELRIDTGAEDLVPTSIDADADGNVVAALVGTAGATSVFEISRIAPNGDTEWTFTFNDAEIELDDDDDDIISPQVKFAPDGSVTVVARVERGVAGEDTFFLRLAPDGTQVCATIHQVDEIEGDRLPRRLAVMDDGSAAISGDGAGNDRSLEWVARFRG